MDCPNCGASDTELTSIQKTCDVINKFGRREITFQAQHINPVQWKNGRYECSRCGLNFSYQEGVKQQLSKRCMYCGQHVIDESSGDWHENALCRDCAEFGKRTGTGPS